MKTNHVMLIGYVGKDLVASKLENGTKRVGIRMATHYAEKKRTGKKSIIPYGMI